MQSPPTGFHLLLLATSFLPSFFLPFLHKLLCPTFLPEEEDLPFPLLSVVPKDEFNVMLGGGVGHGPG